jgi:hypothetical protein
MGQRRLQQMLQIRLGVICRIELKCAIQFDFALAPSLNE